jgi:hypothetical protein
MTVLAGKQAANLPSDNGEYYSDVRTKPERQVGGDGALRRPRRRAQRQATERMAMRASYPARFVTPAPRGHGQHSSLSSTIFETAISD